jgi:shikimate dehydrogenase
MNSDGFHVGLIGAGIQLSKSPALHEEEAKMLGLAYRYELLDAAEPPRENAGLNDLLAEADRRGFAGVNVTHPFKQSVMPLLDGLSEDADMLGAVNTIVMREGKHIGHNTDWYGFYRNFSNGLPDVDRSRAVLLGAGGAGVAVAHAAIKLDIGMLSIFDQDPSRSQTLASQLNERFGRECAQAITDVGKALEQASGLIHATPTGMKAHPGLPIEPQWLQPRHWVADIVYMPLVTELLSLAQAKGCRILPGGGMTVFQAAAAFHLFTGVEPDADRMSRHFEVLCRQPA